MNNLLGLKIALCQMPVVPGRPDLNRDYMIEEIYAAKERGVDIIVFPEMCIPGYVIADLFEDESFVHDVALCTEQVREVTKIGIIAIIGSVRVAPNSRGEDGRLWKANSAWIAQNGKWIGYADKTLQPDYRIFADDRYFVSTRKNWSGIIAQAEYSDYELADFMQPIEVETRLGKIKIGVELCEDMWHEDYPYNPTAMLVENGAEIIFNLSCSPWTWQKNRKRHSVVKKLLQECQVPFVYVNNTGIQNNAKNIVNFDGSSTVYDKDGNIIFEIPAYARGSLDFTFADKHEIIEQKPKSAESDTKELFAALYHATDQFLKTLAPSQRKVIIGLSGGIDSAVVAALMADILGPENIFCINMPSEYNSAETKSIAALIANNLGVHYQIIPIQDVVEIEARKQGVEKGSLAYENIQARERMQILATEAQKRGGVFTCNGNKVELAFGYCTMYADLAGFYAPLADLVKREVYQVGDYLNRIIFQREVIPQPCFDIAPSAELAHSQKDPFLYGNLRENGYHDVMVRAFTEFRKNPEWFIEKYYKGELESELKLSEGYLKRYFPTAFDFIKDLEEKWRMFFRAVIKRHTAPPAPIFSKRAFGFDLRESILSPHLTQRYHELKKFVLAQDKVKMSVALYGGSFNPPCRHHRQIVERLAHSFDKVIVIPCGLRSDKRIDQVNLRRRREMAQLTFGDCPKVEFDFSDLDNQRFTPTINLQTRYEALYPDARIVHVVGADIVVGGRNRESEIHRTWHEGNKVWENLNFVVIERPGFAVEAVDLPPFAEAVSIEGIFGSGTMTRQRIRQNESTVDLLLPEVEEYIRKNGLYK